MVSILVGFFQTVLGFLSGILPNDPFSDFLVVAEDMRLGLAWLNWCLPLSAMFGLMVTWVGLCALVTAVRVFMDEGGDVASLVIGGVK